MSVPPVAPSSSHRVHFGTEYVGPPHNHRVQVPVPKRKSGGRRSSAVARRRKPRSLSKRFKSILQARRRSKKSANKAPRSTKAGLIHLFTSSLRAGRSKVDANAPHECFHPLPPNPVVTELDAATLVSERSHENLSSSVNHPELGLRARVYSEAIAAWVRESLDEYTDPENNEYRHWAHSERIVEWRRYRSRRKIAKLRFGGSDGHEFLVVKLEAQDETEAMYLRFERYIRDRCIDCARGRNYHPLYWQRWDTDDRVTRLDGWPDERQYMQCEGQVFYRREHRLSVLDLLIAAHLAVEAPWTDFWSRYDHWFAVLLGRMLNGRMEKTRRLKQPVASGVITKYGGIRGIDWFRVSNRHERRKIVELIHLCSVIRHREKLRLVSSMCRLGRGFNIDYQLVASWRKP
ncbi:hypothetical protein C0989_002993 [Termitomyces sp. Mn162]|nr:hypothetical protein C0989_002993 [Termitomyces sp. Mn162]